MISFCLFTCPLGGLGAYRPADDHNDSSADHIAYSALHDELRQCQHVDAARDAGAAGGSRLLHVPD